MALALLTLISPLDVLPDLAPPIGWADDLVALLYLVQQALASLRQSK
ncbi:MAG: DUF1232 domain-containing protein [Patescibacteria group bacterium]